MLTHHIYKVQISTQEHLCRAELLPLPPQMGNLWLWLQAQEPKYFLLALGSKSKLTVKGHPTVSYSGNTPLL